MKPAALVLAGSRPGAPDPLAAAQGVAHKALIRVGESTLLERVIAAVRAAGIETVAVAADDPAVVALAQECGVQVVPPASGPSASAAAALEVMGEPLLVTTADHALLEAGWITDFLADSPGDADVTLLMARREDVEAALPGSRRTWLKFADGQWSGCNMFLLATPRSVRAIATWQMVEANRKRPWRIAGRLGLATLLNYALGRLTLAAAIARLGHRIGIVATVVQARDGRAAIDVDKASDLADVRRLIGTKA